MNVNFSTLPIMPINKLILGDNLEQPQLRGYLGRHMVIFLSMIALLALLGCAGNKLVPSFETKTSNENEILVKKDGISTCEDFYEFTEMISRDNDLELEPLLKFAEIPISPRICDKPIVCNGKDYCILWHEP